MSILFSTFVVPKGGKSLSQITILNCNIMKQTLSKISDYSLNKCVDGLNSVISELKDELGENRFSNQLYSMLLTLSIDIDWEYMRRQKESLDKQK